MYIIKTIVGIHVFVMLFYIVAIGVFEPITFEATLLVLPIHIALCVVISLFHFWVYKFGKEKDENKLMYAKANLLSALAIAIVGTPTCTFMVLSKMH